MSTYSSLYTNIIYHNIPEAVCFLKGNESTYPELQGIASFFPTPFHGILIEVEVFGLPDTGNTPEFLGLHIHENGDCSNNFANTGSHYNPLNQQHPAHAGDLPPLLNNYGYSYLLFFDAFLTINDILNRSLVIHRNRDDFTSQPSGDAGEKIACGIITPVKR